jgi:glycosyltransferase involved in cell wall biosynthesis
LLLDLSLIIPAHNEAGRISFGFERLRPILKKLGSTSFEVIVVDDGSSDDTGRIAADIYGEVAQHYVVRQEMNRGKGAAVRLGISAAKGELVIVCDADMAIDPTEIPTMMFALQETPIAAGSRAVQGTIHYESRLRTTSGAAFNRLVRRYVSTTLRDTQCGFKGFQLGAARLLAAFGLVDGFAYDVEMLYLAQRLGLRVATVPVTWNDVPGSSVRVLADSRKMLHDIRALRSNQYECPSVTLGSDVDLAELRVVAREARQSGLVVALGTEDVIVALPRDASLAGVEIANRFKGKFALATPEMFANRQLRAI